MFICRACWRRANSTVTLREAARSSRGRAFIASSASVIQLNAATLSAASDQHSPKDATILPVSTDPAPSKAARGPVANDPNENKVARAVKKHLEHLNNEYNIAIRVQETLAKGRFEEAAMLTREASRNKQVTVSWNHLIDHQMREQKLNSAVKLFNEMKKRAQLPNAQTYTIIFRGCAASVHPKLAVSEAIRIYENMSGKTDTRLKPNTIHLNAVLEVCARAGDIDSMMRIAATANDALNLGAPNNLTYTIMLNALRPKTQPRRSPEALLAEGVLEEDVTKETQATIQKAEAIWQDAVLRWRGGKIMIDEELVCAMGRILLTGNYHHNANVLALVEQTMKLPRLDLTDKSGLSELEALSAHEKSKALNAPPTPPADLEVLPPQSKQLATPSPALSGFARPGNNVLSLILKSLETTRRTTLGPKYWDLLTTTHAVTPDAENYHCYLRLLRTGKASTRSAAVVASMPPSFLAPKTFRIALSTCCLDNLNQHAFANATSIFDVMAAGGLRRPDPRAMRLYLRAARGSCARAFADAGPAGRVALGAQIVRALDRLWEPLRRLRGALGFAAPAARSREEAEAATADLRAEAIAVARRAVGAMDKVITEGLASPEVVKVLKTRKNVLNSQVIRYFETQQGVERRAAERLERDVLE